MRIADFFLPILCFILWMTSCSETERIEIVFFNNNHEILRLLPSPTITFYQKNNRIRAIDIGEEERMLIKNIGKKDAIALKFNGEVIYYAKWYRYASPNILAASRANVYQSLVNNQIIILLLCDDGAIKYDNCSLRDQHHQDLLNFLDQKGQLHSIDSLNLNDFVRNIDADKLF